MGSDAKKPSWPKRISRERAIPSLELAGMVLDQDEDLEPHVEEGDNYETVTLDSDTWTRFVERAREAVGGLLRVEPRKLEQAPEPPDFEDSIREFCQPPIRRDAVEAAFRAGWNAGRRRGRP